MLRSRDSAFSLMRLTHRHGAFDSVEVETTGILVRRHNDAERATKARLLVREPREGRAKSTRRRNRREVSSRRARARVGASGKAPRASLASRPERGRWRRARRAGGVGPGSPRPARPSRVARWHATAAVTALAVLAAVTVRTRDARADETRANHRAVIRRMFSFSRTRHACLLPPPSRVRERSIDRASRRALVARHRRTNRRTNMSLNNTRTSADRSCPLLPTWATIADASSPSRRRFISVSRSIFSRADAGAVSDTCVGVSWETEGARTRRARRCRRWRSSPCRTPRLWTRKPRRASDSAPSRTPRRSRCRRPAGRGIPRRARARRRR